MSNSPYQDALNAICSCAAIFDLNPEVLAHTFDIIFDSKGLCDGPEAAMAYAEEVENKLDPFIRYQLAPQAGMPLACWSLYAAIGAIALEAPDNERADLSQIILREYFRIVIARDWRAARQYLDRAIGSFVACGYLIGPLPGMMPTADRSDDIAALEGA